MGWRGWTTVDRDTKRKLTLRQRYCFVIEKHIEDVKQDQKTIRICGNRYYDLLIL